MLGRHFAPVLPLLLLVLGNGVVYLSKQRSRPGLLIVIGFVGLNLISCLLLRFSERHAKDEYRGAAALGRRALSRHEVVWWNADPQAALVYHLPIAGQADTYNQALFVVNPTNLFAQNLPRPDLVLTSKPDVYDNQGALADYLVRAGFERSVVLTAFTAWRRPPSKHRSHGAHPGCTTRIGTLRLRGSRVAVEQVASSPSFRHPLPRKRSVPIAISLFAAPCCEQDAPPPTAGRSKSFFFALFLV